MTRSRIRVEDVLARMGQAEPEPREFETESKERKQRMVAALNARLERASSGKRAAGKRRVLLGFALAAAVLLGVGAFASYRAGDDARLSAGHGSPEPTLRATRGQVEIVHDGRVTRAPAANAVQLHEADEIRTSAGASANALLASGASLMIRESSRLRLPVTDSRSERIELNKGLVMVQVPHLTDGQTFSVLTPDAKVVVHGTRFSVEVSGSAEQTLTTVAVEEGVVEVVRAGRGVFLGKGAEWRSGAADAPAGSVAPPPAVEASPSAPSVQPVATSSRKHAAVVGGAATESSARPPATSPEVSTLAEENQLYLDAMGASRAGDEVGALAKLDILLRRGQSPLTQQVKVERFRALSRLGRAQDAARAARGYLNEYPNGFARVEALQLANAGTSKP